MDLTADELKQVVEEKHGGTATLFYVAHVHEMYHHQMVGDGNVHVFDLEGHPEATRAYAWATPARGGAQRQFYVVLNIGGVTGPAEAVRVATAGKATGTRPSREPGL